MAISKIILNGTTQIDLTQDTVTAADMRSGVTAHGADGLQKTGSVQTQAGKTVTPTTYNQTAVSSQRITTGNVIVAGDSDLQPGNIKEGVTIFSVTGTYSGGGGSTGMLQDFASVVLDTDNDYTGSWPWGLSVDMVRAVAMGIKPSYGSDYITVGPTAVYETGSGYELDYNDGGNYLGTIILSASDISTYQINTNDSVTLIFFYDGGGGDPGGGMFGSDNVNPVSE